MEAEVGGQIAVRINQRRANKPGQPLSRPNLRRKTQILDPGKRISTISPRRRGRACLSLAFSPGCGSLTLRFSFPIRLRCLPLSLGWRRCSLSRRFGLFRLNRSALSGD